LPSTRELFNQHNLRCTTQRVALYEALKASHAHPTAEELFQLVKPNTEKLSLATVYNTLETLCEAGLVRRIPTSHGCCRYDGDISAHPHMRDQDTGEIIDVPHDLSHQLMHSLSDDVLRRIERETGVQVQGVSIQILVKQPPQDTPPRDDS
jgi:Fur family peroxide stress response transcriptional regulator